MFNFSKKIAIAASFVAIYSGQFFAFASNSGDATPMFSIRQSQESSLFSLLTREVDRDLPDPSQSLMQHTRSLLQLQPESMDHEEMRSRLNNLNTYRMPEFQFSYQSSGAAGGAPPPDDLLHRKDMIKYLEDMEKEHSRQERLQFRNDVFSTSSSENISIYEAFCRMQLSGNYFSGDDMRLVPLTHRYFFDIEGHIEGLRERLRLIELSYEPLRLIDILRLDDQGVIPLQPQLEPAQPFVDRENVERADRHNKTRAAVEAIYAEMRSFPIDEKTQMDAVVAYLQKLKASNHYSSYKRKYMDAGSALEMNEIDNALRTICAPRMTALDFASINDGDVYLTLQDGTQMTVRGLLTRSWIYILNQTEGLQLLLKDSLVRALGQCIEDDNHRVCSNGKSQRIVTTLQGYIEGIEMDDSEAIRTINEFIAVFLSNKQDKIIEMSEKPDDERLAYARSLYQAAMESADKYYAGSETHLKQVKEEISSFISTMLSSQDDLEK
ncbi:MAG: hypothetical protein KBB83_00515 [Alphaproteobacteria bacterium]|nr:hypothetical protein [Alphaproteobacteria bacterium]